jgi:AraC-like DNA-binding protein
VEPLVPGGRIEMIFNMGSPIDFMVAKDDTREQTIKEAHLMGQRGHICYARASGNINLIGIRFKPGGISAFTYLPAAILANELIDAEDVLGKDAKQWKGRLLDKQNEKEQVMLLDQLLTQLAKETGKEWSSCVNAVDIIRQSASISVNVLCDENESYYKKLERDFLKYIGYTPKHYHRIVRFNRALRQMALDDDSLTVLSYDNAYYDQSHFIRDFRQFTGTTPKKFKKERHVMADFLTQQQPV